MKSLMTIVLICTAVIMHGQANIKVEVSADTVAAGEIVEVSYTIENGDGRFEMPEFEGVPLVSGPNTSSSFTIINGEKSSSQTYSFFFRATENHIQIPEARYHEGDQVQVIEPVTIIVSDARQDRPSLSATKPSTLAKREKKKI